MFSVAFRALATWLAVAFCGASEAQTHSSADYTVSAEAFDGGGSRVQSASYRVDTSVSAIGGLSSAPFETVKHGYVGQLYDLTALAVSGPPTDALSERATRQLQAVAIADDLTALAPLNPSTVTWSVLSGPIASVTIGGLATAGTVYQNSAAVLRGSALGLSGDWSVTVLNVTADDYQTYANDGIDDAWQVTHFGEENPLAAPGVDADGDGQNNLFEYTAGLVPTDPNSIFRLRIERVAGQPAQRALIFSPRFNDRTYTPQFVGSLAPGQWQPLTGTTQADNGTERTITDPNGTGASKFYRIQITKP